MESDLSVLEKMKIDLEATVSGLEEQLSGVVEAEMISELRSEVAKLELEKKHIREDYEHELTNQRDKFTRQMSQLREDHQRSSGFSSGVTTASSSSKTVSRALSPITSSTPPTLQSVEGLTKEPSTTPAGNRRLILIEGEYRRLLGDFQEKHRSELETIKQEWQNRLSQDSTDQRVALAALRRSHNEEIDRLKKTMVFAEELKSLEQQYKKEVAMLRSQLEEFLSEDTSDQLAAEKIEEIKRREGELKKQEEDWNMREDQRKMEKEEKKKKTSDDTVLLKDALNTLKAFHKNETSVLQSLRQLSLIFTVDKLTDSPRMRQFSSSLEVAITKVEDQIMAVEKLLAEHNISLGVTKTITVVPSSPKSPKTTNIITKAVGIAETSIPPKQSPNNSSATASSSSNSSASQLSTGARIMRIAGNSGSGGASYVIQSEPGASRRLSVSGGSGGGGKEETSSVVGNGSGSSAANSSSSNGASGDGRPVICIQAPLMSASSNSQQQKKQPLPTTPVPMRKRVLIVRE